MFKRKNVITREFIESRINIDSVTGCWNWQGYIQSGGYGQTRIDNRPKLAHRSAWELYNDQRIPDGLCVCHKCDNRKCCNPAHLFIGTHKDNMQDCEAKDRRAMQKPGFNFAFTRVNRQRKLTDRQVRAIRATLHNGELLKDIAERFGVTMSCVSVIRRGKRKKLVV